MIDRRLFALGRPRWHFMPVQCGFALLLTGLIIGQMHLLSEVIAEVFMGDTRATPWPLLGWLLGLITLRAALIAGQQYYSQAAASAIKVRLQARLLTHWAAVGPVRLHTERTGELVAVYQEGVDKLEAYFSRYLPRVVQVLITPLAIAVVVGTVDRLSGLILLGTAPLIPIFMWLIGSMAKKRIERQWAALSRMSAHFLDLLQGIPTLKLFSRSREQEGAIARVSNRYRITTMGVLKVAFLSALVLELAASLSTAIVAVQIGVRLVEGLVSFQPGLFVLLLAPEFYLPFRHLGSEHHAGMESKEAATRIQALLDQSPLSVPAYPHPVPGSREAIHLQAISYTYPGRTQAAVDQLDLTLQPDEMLALVGPSGSGKSTLFRLLARHLDPDSGRIRIGPTDIQDIAPEDWRRHLAVVPQHPTLFRGTVAGNLRMARPDASLEALEEAATQAEAHAFIAALPQGYDTPLGEHGWRLSVGERQRLALARAFLKAAPVLLLDEPSANLDPESEECIALAIERLTRNRTTAVIAHRLRTVYRAHRIAVLDAGRVVELGTHRELAQANGLYARLLGAPA